MVGTSEEWGVFGKWFRSRREEREKRNAERERIGGLFQAFLEETKPLVPRVAPKHPEAALLRHAWKRAGVLGILHTGHPQCTAEYRALQELAAERYYAVAPDTLYGKARLRMDMKAANRLMEEEAARALQDSGEARELEHSALACIYLGTTTEGHVYVGQTISAPERRWVQHRVALTGPFKGQELYVTWRVVVGPVDPQRLDELESYYIGFYDAYKGDNPQRGLNETRGNDVSAYVRGHAQRGSKPT
jgi:hypothetical protein